MQMRRRSRQSVIGAMVVILVGAALICGCRKTQANQAPPPASVTVAHPIDREVMEWDEFPGRLFAKPMVEVRAKVGGYIQSIAFKEGSIVNKGDLLFVIETRPYEIELARTKGELGRAKAHLALAQTEFKRVQGLVPTEAASEIELDEKKANLADTEAAVVVAEANVEAAQLNLEYTHVRAEITGRISDTRINEGNLITAGQGNNPLLTTITSLDPIYCQINADERSVLKYQRLAQENKRPDVRKENVRIPARLALLNEDEFDHIGYIDFVDNSVDPTTGTLGARGVFPNPGGEMTPGLFARMRVPGAAPYRTILISEQAIQNDQNAKFVLTVDEKLVVHRTPVTLGTLFGSLRAIQSGLTIDDQVVVNGLMRARPGMPVKAEVGPMPGASDAERFATTRVTEPTTAPTVPPTTRPAASPISSNLTGHEAFLPPLVGVPTEVAR